MPRVSTETDQDRRIALVIDYIFKHTAGDLSVDTLAAVAHYSPDHLQKLFKQVVGETPKQYSLQLQLETAFLYLIIHPDRPIAGVSLDCGFSSPAIFSRAIKNYFGHSPGQLRELPHKQRMTILHKAQPHHPETPPPTAQPDKFAPPDIRIVQKPRVRGIYLLTSFDDPIAIRKAFQSLTRYAQKKGEASPSLYGILSPLRRNSYRAFLPFSANGDELLFSANSVHPYPECEIPAGTYANFSVQGDLPTTKKAVHYFGHRWLPVNGYKVAGFEGFETFTENPAGRSYASLQRQIYIPIEPEAPIVSTR